MAPLVEYPHRQFELSYWINERYSIKLRKESGVPRPWTIDPAMEIPRYCNVHREDDRVTKWIAKNWRNKNVGDPNFVLGMVVARMINLPNTLEVIGFPHEWKPKKIVYDLNKLQSEGEKIWTSAYTISTAGQRISKQVYVIEQVCDEVATRFRNETFKGYSLAGAHRELMKVDGLGSFLAAQVVADLKNTPGHALQDAVDWHTWAAPGPGSLRGLSWYFYGNPNEPIGKYFENHINVCKSEVTPLIHSYVPAIHMQDFQNCLCEFSKYMKYKSGDTRVRNKYRSG